LLAVTLASCAKSGSRSATPNNLWAIVPTQDQVRTLMGDSNWYQGPPTFDVSPLDAGTRSLNLEYGLRMSYLHIGTDEQLFVEYEVLSTTSAATAFMTDLQNAHSGEPTTPKVGDQTLYYGATGNGGAPYEGRTFVRVGQIITALALSQKSPNIQVDMLAKVARAFTGKLSNLSKVHPSPAAVDAKGLPPPGRSITRLGAANLPAEAFTVMTGTALPDNFTALLHQSNLNSFAYGDYVLNNDTHMEVQTAFFTLPSAADATGFAKIFGGGATADADGIYWQYVPTGGTPAAGEYHYSFSQGQYGLFMICKASVGGEAASRECEDPVHTTAISWQLALQGLG
jgi:hypothetical protein